MTVSLPKPLPIPDVPLIDGATLKLKQPWREYFESLDRAVRALIGVVGTGAVAVADLPSAAVAGVGDRAFVTDANDTTFNSIVADGGTDTVPVVSNGTDWLIG